LYEQTLACQAGVELLVCTPGRLIDLIKKKGTNLQRVTFLVLDEADRMFDMGFEPQVTSIADHVRPLRQTLLFSATFKKKVEKLAREILVDPIRIIQGSLGEVRFDLFLAKCFYNLFIIFSIMKLGERKHYTNSQSVSRGSGEVAMGKLKTGRVPLWLAI
jgi:hypothetical protein